MSEIRDGVEFYKLPDGEQGEQCARCGSSVYFEDCENCGGTGEPWDEGDEVCDTCQGRGGYWLCISDWHWCMEHPLRGRENIQSTARVSRLPEESPKP